MIIARFLRTPTDFGATIGAEQVVRADAILPPPAELEPKYRGALDAIFTDLDLIDSQDARFVSAYLEDLANPLNELRLLGYSILALQTSGVLTLPAGAFGSDAPTRIPDWKRTYYLVVPSSGFFRVGGETSGTVHRFSDDCTVAIRTLSDAIQKEVPVMSWGGASAVLEDLERNVPWCVDCCIDLPGKPS